MSQAAARTRSTLIYAADEETGGVDVYDYATGSLVGTLSGLIAQAGCVDAKGDVILVSGNGTALEYAHGGTTPTRTYTPGGDLVGCSVDRRGDIAFTVDGPGRLVVYRGGNPNDVATYSDTECVLQQVMGYDNRGNVIGEGEYTSVNVCAVLRKAHEEKTLSTDGISINFGDGTMWDGKYVELSDQEAGTGKSATGLIQASLSGTTLSSQGETILADTCYRGLVDVLNPFVLGTKNTPVNDRQGSVVVGSNLYCASAGTPSIEYWHYPAGGDAFTSFSTTDIVTVVAVSIGT
jgi:hypothetical protein